MQTLVKPFDFKGTPVRTLTYETGQTWWVLADIVKALDLSSTTRVAKRLDDDGVSQAQVIDSMGREQTATIVNESGLYEVILRSDKPQAKEFRHWVTSDVLPTIRRTGSYGNPQDRKTLLATAFIEAKNIIEEQEKQLTAQAPKVLFADAVAASHTNILVGDLAKILHSNGIDIGGTRLFQWLRDNGYLMKSGMAKNMPTQKSMELGLFKVKETIVVHADGHTSINKTPKVTGKGQAYFVSKFLAGKDLVLA